MKITAVVLALFLSLPAIAQRKDRSDAPQQPVINEGVVYSLPMTGIRVVVTAQQTTTVPGPYAPYAEQLLGIRNVKMQPETRWEITSVNLETFGQADPTHTYLLTGAAAGALQLTAEGILAGIHTHTLTGETSPNRSVSLAVEKMTDDLTFHTLIDNPSVSGRTSPDQRAMQAANRILRSRNARFDIAAGLLDEFHPDGEAYRSSMQELHSIENELLTLFTGKSACREYTFSFDYLPKGATEGDVAFRFDESRGFLPISDLSGKPVMISVSPDSEMASRLQNLQASGTPIHSTSQLNYRQPGRANVTVLVGLEPIASGSLVLAQFGTVAPLPPALLSGSFAIAIHPVTGALLSVTPR